MVAGAWEGSGRQEKTYCSCQGFAYDAPAATVMG